MDKNKVECVRQHDRPRAAVIRVQVKSTRVGHPGRPMIREITLCKAHAQELKSVGIEVVGA